MATRKVHMIDIRLYNNAGISMPSCYAARKGPLDMDKTHLPVTSRLEDCTCRVCQRVFPKRYSWTIGRKP